MIGSAIVWPRARRALAAMGGLLLLLGASASSLQAHANLDQSRPAADQVLASGPDRVWMSFTEAADAAGTSLAVLDSSGGRVNLGDATLAANGREATVGLVPLGRGVYTVAWQSRSAEDGDDAQGFFAFAVDTPGALPVLNIKGPNGANPGRAMAADLTVDLAALPAGGCGPNTLEVKLASGGTPVADAQRVTLRLSSLTQNLGVAVIQATSQDDGRYLAATWLPSLAGQWQAEVRIRRAGLEDVSASFTMETGS